MKVLEIKNNLVKIAYDASENLALSGFVVIQDENSPYVAQVMNIKADVTSNYAIVKLLFTFNEEGILKNYNGTIPSLKSTVTKLPSNELLDIIPVENPIILGQLAQQDVQLKVDKTILDNNLLVCSNNVDNTATLINNIVKQIEEKIVIFDTKGDLDWENKIVFGKDFKLPLNYETINFIYENDLEDLDPTNKAVIQEIFIEVQEYTRTLPEGYIPFNSFLTVVDQQYKETQIPQLALLKNKLLKYRDLEAFAETLKDVVNLNIAIDKSQFTVVDISDIPEELQKEVMMYAYSVMEAVNKKIYSFVNINNSNTSKKLLKKFIQRKNIYTTVVCPHEYKYINLLKENAQNIIFFAPLTLQHDFASYNTFLNKLNANEYIVYGAHTQNIPLIVELEDIELKQNNDSDENETNKEIDNNEISDKNIEIEDSNKIEIANDTEEDSIENSIEEDILEPEIEIDEPEITEVEETETVNIMEPEISENSEFDEKDDVEEEVILETPEEPQEQIFPEHIEYPDIEVSEEPIEIVEKTTPEPEMVTDEKIQIVEENNSIPNILEDDIEIEPYLEEPVLENNNEDIYTSKEDPGIEVEPLYPTEELNNEETENNEDVYIDYSVEDSDINEAFNEPVLEEPNEEIVEQIAKDVDRAFYEKLDDNGQSMEEPEIDELTEDDLNLIDDINSDNSNEDSIQINEFGTNQTPVVPIYPADDIESDITNTLKPGDRVSTPKYGEGVVEKMIKYGNKMLCSIEFPNIGRRLLDPAMSEIKKLS